MSPASATVFGALILVAGGLISGSGAWPMKLMKRYQFEHWWFIAMMTGLVVVPWTVTLVFCPHAFRAYRAVPWNTLAVANLWAAAWGVANVLCGICYVRLGMALTTAIITGLGVAFGVTLPMVVKGSGLFKDASDPLSPAGLTLLGAVGVLLLAVILASLAAAGRHRSQPKTSVTTTNFPGSFLMALAAGVLSCGMALSFVYSQGPIMEAMRREGAGEIPATFAVWAVGLLGGAVVSLAYPSWMMTKKRSWTLLGPHPKEFLLAILIGSSSCVSVVFLGLGMRMLGPLGASVGIGLQAASWMLGGQVVGFLSGEWRGVHGRPRRQLYLAILCLLAAVGLMVRGNLLSPTLK